MSSASVIFGVSAFQRRGAGDTDSGENDEGMPPGISIVRHWLRSSDQRTSINMQDELKCDSDHTESIEMQDET